jgi:WD40 repeat protein
VERLLEADVHFRPPVVSSGPRPLLAAGDEKQKVIAIYDLLAGKKRLEIRTQRRMRPFALSPGGGVLAALDLPGPEEKEREDETAVTLWDAASGEELGRFTAEGRHRAGDVPAAFTPDGRRLLLAGRTGKGVVVYEVPSGRVVRRLAAKGRGRVRLLAVRPDGKRVAVVDHYRNTLGERKAGRRPDEGAANWAIDLHDLEGEGPPMSLQGHVQPVLCLAFSPDGRTLASGGQDRMLRLWHVQTGLECLALRHDSDVDRVFFSPEGDALPAAEDRNRWVTLWESARGSRGDGVGQFTPNSASYTGRRTGCTQRATLHGSRCPTWTWSDGSSRTLVWSSRFNRMAYRSTSNTSGGLPSATCPRTTTTSLNAAFSVSPTRCNNSTTVSGPR